MSLLQLLFRRNNFLVIQKGPYPVPSFRVSEAREESSVKLVTFKAWIVTSTFGLLTMTFSLCHSEGTLSCSVIQSERSEGRVLCKARDLQSLDRDVDLRSLHDDVLALSFRRGLILFRHSDRVKRGKNPGISQSQMNHSIWISTLNVVSLWMTGGKQVPLHNGIEC